MPVRPARILAAWLVLAACGLPGSQPAAAAAAPPTAVDAPTDARPGLPARLVLTYALARGPLEIGRVEETYTRDGDTYVLTSEARAIGIAAVLARGQGWRRESRGRVGSEGLRPEEFVDQRGANPALRARFDWDAGQIRFERTAVDAAAPTAAPAPTPLPAGTTDRLSFPYSLAQRGRLPDAPWETTITDGRRVSQYRFTVAGRETLDTPAGRFETVRVSRVRERDDAGTDIWLALDRQMIPVRILFTEPDGTLFDQVLLKIGLP